MAAAVEIKCINKNDRNDPHERILSIGGVNATGTRWKMSQSDAINAIENGTYSFYVSAAKESAWVIVRTRNGRKYLRTQTDDTKLDNLLSLPECP